MPGVFAQNSSKGKSSVRRCFPGRKVNLLFGSTPGCGERLEELASLLAQRYGNSVKSVASAHRQVFHD